jgi:hypothetical protein
VVARIFAAVVQLAHFPDKNLDNDEIEENVYYKLRHWRFGQRQSSVV